jgi:hypothetical protein
MDQDGYDDYYGDEDGEDETGEDEMDDGSTPTESQFSNQPAGARIGTVVQ